MKKEKKIIGDYKLLAAAAETPAKINPENKPWITGAKYANIPMVAKSCKYMG